MKKYDLIYADPPWHFKVHSPKGEGRSAIKHYPVMGLKDIIALPIKEIANDDSLLLLWVTDPFLEKAFEVIHAWGFEYKTVGFYWVKLNKLNGMFFMGTGYYTRANPEQCLLCTRGKGLPRIEKDVRKLVVSNRGRHSEKPTRIYSDIERLFGRSIKGVELFARMRRPGWDAFGNEIEGSIKL